MIRKSNRQKTKKKKCNTKKSQILHSFSPITFLPKKLFSHFNKFGNSAYFILYTNFEHISTLFCQLWSISDWILLKFEKSTKFKPSSRIFSFIMNKESMFYMSLGSISRAHTAHCKITLYCGERHLECA